MSNSQERNITAVVAEGMEGTGLAELEAIIDAVLSTIYPDYSLGHAC
jgi:hypothetical protein